MSFKMLLFDLDQTLLRTDKTISRHTLDVLRQCREKGLLLGISTSRSELNCEKFISELKPDIIISSGGALVRDRDVSVAKEESANLSAASCQTEGNSFHDTEWIIKFEFTPSETKRVIELARTVCGVDCEITVDTMDGHYWNYKIDPKELDASWGESIYCDFLEFSKPALKICVEIFDSEAAQTLKQALPDCDCIRFSDGYWYKFTKKTATKEHAIVQLCRRLGISTENVMAFGDDYADIGMLKLCGRGVAMGNALDEVKAAADVTIGTNDEEGIAEYLKNFFQIVEIKESRNITKES